ncbi:hypothetical protein [Phosphitispora sp. TUW77]|uniref:hypothetical protein n=1 Tax=Phosphitispora sp. TUW77 TaxID=3152361 RepID=UPI003AB77EA9
MQIITLCRYITRRKLFWLRRSLAPVILTAFLLSLFFCAAACRPAQASAGTGSTEPKVVMVVLNRITLEDLLDDRYQNISKLISKGGLGLMTINTAGDYNDASAYLSIGGGNKFNGSQMAGESYTKEEVLPDGSKAKDVYVRNTGNNPAGSEILNINIPVLLKINKNKNIDSVPGQLGLMLHESGLKTAVIGNSDTNFGSPANRPAVLIAMDQLGRVDYGNVSRELLIPDRYSPYGWRTDYDKLTAELEMVWDKSDLIVVETGDTLRSNNSNLLEMKRMIDSHRLIALKNTDRFIGRLLLKADKNTLIMIVTPLPYAQAIRDGIRVTPLVMAGGTVEPGSILVSPSTRQEALVANFDLAATAARHLGAAHSGGLIGLPVTGVVIDNQKDTVADVQSWLLANWTQRSGILYYFIRYHWIIYILALVQVIVGFSLGQGCIRFLLAALLLYPLAILLVPLAGYANKWLSISLSILILALITFVLTRIRNNLKMFLAIAIASAMPCVIDVLTGARLMKTAALGYDLVAGGRFYGIGNEYMGVVIGASILGAAILLQLYSKTCRWILPLIGLGFAGLVIFFAAPEVGTNAGGSLAAVVGFAVSLYLFSGRKMKFRSVILIMGAVITGLGILVLVNYFLLSGYSSHIGRAINNAIKGDLAFIWFMVQRKLVANFYLLRHSPFSVILILQFLLGLAIAARKQASLVKLAENYKFMANGMAGIFFGALGAFVFNDSGVIAAAIMLNYLIIPPVLLIFQREFQAD